MAQGKTKLKANPHAKAKSRAQKKQTPLKKGKLAIAPKKAKKIAEMKLKKGLERAINAKIESEVTSQATAAEPKSFQLLSKPESASKSKKKK